MVPPLDTNIIRYLTGDHPDQSPRCYETFRQLPTGSQTATLTEAELVETDLMLSSKALYHLPRPDIQRHLVCRNGATCGRELYEAHPFLWFVDALLVADAEASLPATVLSFDHGFDLVLQRPFLPKDITTALDVAGPRDRLMPPSPAGPAEHLGEGVARGQPRHQAAQLGDAERDKPVAVAVTPPFARAVSPARMASAQSASVTCRCQPRQERVS